MLKVDERMARQGKTQVETKQSKYSLLGLSFIEGGSVMAIELLAAKMIAPYFGSSLHVWSAVLATTLAGLTVGYFLGGQLSQRTKSPIPLYYLVLITACLSVLLPTIGPVLLNALLDAEPHVGAIQSSLVLVFPPLVAFGMISPLIIAQLTEHVDESGATSGKVYAISTLGGILFTFLAGFVAIPEFGLLPTAAVISILLCTAAVYFFSRSRKYLALVGTMIIMGWATLSLMKSMDQKSFKTDNLVETYSSDGLLGRLTVYDLPTQGTRCMYTNNISISYMHVPSKRSQWKYVHRIATYTSFLQQGSEVFLAGLGAGNLVGEFNLLGFETDVVELDPRIPRLAREYFDMKGERSVIIDDARHAIRTSNNQYDLVVLDVSAGESQPNNLYTLEAFLDIKKIMKPEGFLFIHYPSFVTGKNARALKSIGKTLGEAGFAVEFVNTSPGEGHVTEMLIVANAHGATINSKSFVRRDSFSEPFKFPLNNITMPYDCSEGMIMTDDKPIMDKLHLNNAKYYRNQGIQTILKPMAERGLDIL